MTLEMRRLRVSGGELAYVDEGRGKPVVFLHGFPTSSHLWRDLLPLVATRSRAVAVDLLGYGDSEKPADARLDIRAQATYVRELLARLEIDPFAAVGHDVGGGVAQLLALEGGVECLVLMNAISFDGWPVEGVRLLQETDPRDADLEIADQVVRLAFDLGMGHRDRLRDEDLEEFLRPWRDDPPALLRAARGIDGEGLSGTEDRLAALDIPVFVIWGEEDPFLPASRAEKLGDVLPGSTVALLPGCSHYVLEDATETVAPMVVEYLRVTYLGERGHAPAHAVPTELGVSFERPDPAADLPDEGD
jgi:2-hydroxymuconate-semialdehyde hydrolase